MHILLTDETNQQPSSEAKFFVYGGLFFPVEKLTALHDGIESIRRSAGYRDEDELKFHTRSRPEQVSHDAATQAKREVLALCTDAGCRFIVHLILHDIIANQEQDQQVQWAADYVIGRFNEFLREENGHGICVVDNLPRRSEFRYLSDKFTRGLTLDNGSTIRLDRVKLLASTCIGASHAASAMDIVLGSFRYCINSPSNVEAAKEMLPKVMSMMWHKEVGDTRYVRNRGLIFRPNIVEIRVEEYRLEYEALLSQLKELSFVNEVVPTAG